MKTLPVEACPGCGSRQCEHYTIGPPTDLRRCTSCALVYAPEMADPVDIYKDGYLLGGSEGGFGPVVTDPAFQRFLDYCGDVRMSWMARVAQPPGTWLDVGCGTGEVLGAVVRAGWTGTGVEPVAASVRWATEQRPHLDIRPVFLEESGLPERSFDVVSTFHVLEHMTDAPGFLRTAARWARPGGLLVVEVPNIHSYQRKGWGGGWPLLQPLEHVAHFSPTTLAKTLRAAGVEPILTKTGTFLWEGQTLDEALSDLGLLKYRKRLGWLGRSSTVKGQPAVVPSKAGWPVLHAASAVYDRFSVGQVNFAVCRVP